MRPGRLPAAAALLACCACSGADGGLPAEYRRLTVPDELLAAPEARARGRRLYLEHCALCHGERGDGRGRRRNLSSRPVDFTDPLWRRSASPRRVFFAIREGIAGTAMAGWKILDVEESWSLVAYLLSVADPEAATRGSGAGSADAGQLLAREHVDDPPSADPRAQDDAARMVGDDFADDRSSGPQGMRAP